LIRSQHKVLLWFFLFVSMLSYLGNWL
jgi:hypothetical protein